MKKMIAFFLSCSFLLISMSGCIPAKELNEKLIVQAIGLDSEDGEFVVTLQAYFPQGGGGQSFVDMSKPNNKVVQGRGETITQAVQDAEVSQGKEVFYGHNELIIVGNTLAKEGLSSISSFLNSFNELRPNIQLLVAEDTAEEIVRAQIEGGILPAQVLGKAASSGEETGYVTQCTLIDVMKSLKGDGSQIYAPVVETDQDAEDKTQAVFEKTAVFRSGQLAGTLTEAETRGLMWINDQITRANILVENTNYGKISAQITHATTRRKTRMQDGKISIHLHVSTRAIISERVSGDISPVLDEDIDDIQAELARTITKEMEQALEIGLRDYHTDIFNFSGDVSKYEPQYYLAHRDHWEKVLPEFQCVIEVDCNVDRLGIETK
ncbi:Ger(x)C family spore germination protein [Zongyangia hominis]|uniref:Ger(X)C family spore germination protein n=1 Tax=Zongyangia hominis TaxID=2763677 RepID=A0A926E971_9FIRM|nr:Ger(x)C family spore germination protein [Zongyangia hominis]MBC8569518.1 Ger(x)C family spore germination protein [Zongyangia hominis]